MISVVEVEGGKLDNGDRGSCKRGSSRNAENVVG